MRETRIIDESESQLAPRMEEGIARRMDEPLSALSILNNAIVSGMAPEALEKLVALSERMADRAAAQEFAAAMAAFKAACPPVPRRAINQQFAVTRNGAKVERRYASLEDIESTIRPHMGAAGLAFRWSGAEIVGPLLRVTCTVSHVGGHSEDSTVSLPFDSKAGCSDQQKMGAAMTYAQRYSLVQALGLTSCDGDTDGNEDPANTIGEHDAANMEAALADLRPDDQRRFLQWAGVDAVRQIRGDRVKACFDAIGKKRESYK